MSRDIIDDNAEGRRARVPQPGMVVRMVEDLIVGWEPDGAITLSVATNLDGAVGEILPLKISAPMAQGLLNLLALRLPEGD